MARLLVVHALALSLFALPLTAEVRSISDAERAAVQIAADYLARGPEAVAERLASGSALRGLPPSVQLAEIETRLGPPGGATWELQTVVPALKDRMAAFTVTYPSGVDDHLLLELVPESGGYRIADIRFLAQPSSRAPLFAPPDRAVESRAVEETAVRRHAPIAVALLAVALSTAAAFGARRRNLSRALLAASLLVLGAASWLLVTPTAKAAEKDSAAPSASPPQRPSVAPLLPLRRAIANGDPVVTALLGSLDRRDGRGAIADLWTAQARLLQSDVAAARTLLKAFPAPSDRPLAELVRGRLALFDGDESAAAVAFENAVNLGPGRDGVWLEAAELLASLGFDQRANATFLRLARLGSREADVYYQLAVAAAADGRDDEAEGHLRTAWGLRPEPRARLVTTGVFWSLIRRSSVASLIGFSRPEEALVTAAAAGTRPIALPTDTVASTIGELLGMSVGSARLVVPGGAVIAPVGTPVVPADAWHRDEESRRLADFPALAALATDASSYAQPALRQRLSGTAEALSARNRWADLVRLTDGLNASAEHVPPEVLFLRSIGLQRTARGEEARRLVTQLAASPVLQRKRDPVVLMELAELLAGHDLYDAAVRMYDRAQTIRPNPFIDDRVRQIQMSKHLATRFSQRTTDHFDIRYPEEISATSAAALGEVLESELARLQEWIPVPQFSRVTVNVLFWHDFRSTYTGSDFILGFYNGKITVPFAGVDTSDPFIVSILGHELAHAMIAQATGNHAPRWFQEGLAQRIERRAYHRNAFNMYDDDRLIPISLLDAVLGGSPDPGMIGGAYVVAQTDIRYIESRYGKAGIRAMLQAYRDGATNAEAITRLSGREPGQFEVELRQWGRSGNHVFDNREAR